MIGLAVSGATRCRYCAYFHAEAARLFGATEDEITETAMIAKNTMGWSTYLNTLQFDYDASPRSSTRSPRTSGADGRRARRPDANPRRLLAAPSRGQPPPGGLAPSRSRARSNSPITRSSSSTASAGGGSGASASPPTPSARRDQSRELLTGRRDRERVLARALDSHVKHCAALSSLAIPLRVAHATA